MVVPVSMVFSSISVGLPSAVVAQESVTSNSIRITIFALLAIAALLMVLTVWFWRHTDPKKRRAPAAVAPAATPARRTDPTGSARPAAAASTGADRPSVTTSAASASAARAAATPDEVAQLRAALGIAGEPGASAPAGDDDDWLRLTGPDALPPTTRKPGTPSS